MKKKDKPGIIHAKTAGLITLCGSLEQAESLIKDAREKGDKGEIIITPHLMTDTSEHVIRDLRSKTKTAYFNRG